MLQGWHSGSHAPGRLCGAAGEGAAHLSPPLGSYPASPHPNSGAGSILAPQPCQSLGGCPAGGVGGTDAVGRRRGESESCPRTVPHMGQGLCPILPHLGPHGAGAMGGQVGGQEGPGQRCNPPPAALHVGVRACVEEGSRAGASLVPHPWPDPGQGRGGAVGGLSRGSGGVMAIPYGMFWEILLTPG